MSVVVVVVGLAALMRQLVVALVVVGEAALDMILQSFKQRMLALQKQLRLPLPALLAERLA